MFYVVLMLIASINLALGYAVARKLGHGPRSRDKTFADTAGQQPELQTPAETDVATTIHDLE